MLRRQLRNYAETNMLAAIEEVNKGMSYKAAARKHSVPRVTLMDKHKGRAPVIAKMGPPSVFSPEQETALIEWVRCMARAGFPVSRETFMYSAAKLAKEMKLKFGKNDKPGRKWFTLFLSRNPGLSLRVSQNLTAMRRNVSQTNIDRWFEEVETYLKEHSLMEVLSDPRRVFNTDETAFFLNPKPGKVLAEKGSKNVYTAAGNDEKFNLTVLITANASGQLAPPMVVYRHVRIPPAIAESFPPDWSIGRSENGWMTHELFFEYMANIFLPWVKSQQISLPIIFFMDGHSSHISLHLSQFCKDQGIELIALYPNATHILQPLDVAVFHSLKSCWRQKVQEWRMENEGKQLRKQDFAPLLKPTLQTISETTIQNGFKKCGLVPWNPRAVKVEKSFPSINKEESQKSKFLLMLENEMGKETVDMFSQNQGEWQGPLEHKSLFDLWKKLKDKETQNHDNITAIVEQGEQVLEENLEENLEHNGERYEPDEQVVEMIAQDNEKNVIESVHTTPAKKTEETGPELPSTSGTSKTSAFKPDVSLPSPFKRILTWPEPKNVCPSKRKREKLPAVVTSPLMLEYYRKKENQKLEIERQKEERKKARELKKKDLETRKLEQQKTQKKMRKLEEKLSSDSSSDEMSLQESDASEWDERSDEEEEISVVNCLEELKEGDFVLVEFKGGKRLVSNFVYLCVIQKITSVHEIEIMGMKSTDLVKKNFIVNEKDISLTSLKQIKGRVSQPNVITTGERVRYQFAHALPVKEM